MLNNIAAPAPNRNTGRLFFPARLISLRWRKAGCRMARFETNRPLRRRSRAPQGPGRNPRAFDQGFQLRPHDRRMNTTRERAFREAAIGAAHDLLATDDLR